MIYLNLQKPIQTVFLRYIKRGNTIDPLMENEFGVPLLLFSIVESGSIELLDYISTNMNIDWNQTNKNGVPLIFWSSTDEMVRYLITKGADPFVQDEVWGSFLHVLIDRNLIGVMSEFISNKSMLNSLNDKEQTPLIYAILVGNPDAVQILLDAGADVTLTDNKNKTAIYYALQQSLDSEQTKRLVSMGADINWMDENNNTLLHEFFSENTLSLRYFDFDLDKQNKVGQTAFHKAIAMERWFDIEEYPNLSATYNLNINTTDIYGKTPLISAIDNELDMIFFHKLLIQGAQLNVGALPVKLNTLDNDSCVLSYTTETGEKRQTDIIRLDSSLCFYAKIGNVNAVKEEVNRIQINGGSIDRPATSGLTALHIASWKGHVDIVELLLAANASVDQEDAKDGWTALHLASRFGYVDIVELLLAASASVDQEDAKDGWTALHYASHYGHVDIVELLLAAGASVDQEDVEDGWTALHYASSSGHVDIVKLLLAAGASVDQEDAKDGWTALHYASHYGHVDIIGTLVSCWRFG